MESLLAVKDYGFIFNQNPAARVVKLPNLGQINLIELMGGGMWIVLLDIIPRKSQEFCLFFSSIVQNTIDYVWGAFSESVAADALTSVMGVATASL